MPLQTDGLSMALATGVLDTQFAQLPPRTVQATRRALLDALGVMHAASGLSAEVRPFMTLALSQGGRAEASVFGLDGRVPAPLAALANGAMAHALDYEDAFDAAPVHPNAALIPAVLALAQARGPVSGAELITAIAAGCDLVCRLGLCLRQPLEQGGWYPPPILGAMGAVAGAARLLQLEPRQLVDAWSLMLLQNSCPAQIRHDADSVLRAVREAFPAQAAVTCVLLAEAGIRGFSEPLEGAAGFFHLFAAGRYEPADLLRDLGSRWHIDDLSFKPWPSCRGTHAAIEATLALRASERFELRDVGEIVIEGGPVQAMLAEPLARKQAPATAIDAKFSLPFTVATALHSGAVTLDSFDAAARAAPQVLALARRVRFELRAEWGQGQATSGCVAIALQDGRTLRQEVLVPLGSPARPLEDSRLVAKFVDCLSRSARPLDATAARALAVGILGLESNADAGALIWPA